MLHTRVETGDTPVIHLEGEIDLDSVETFRWAVTDALRGATEAILDFSRVTFIDSSGTGLLVRLCLDSQAQGVQLRLRDIPPVVDDVFKMLKVRALVGEEAFVD
ncbi:MAG TPA: STAS domain-containing protein [Thermoleophilia bacterium]|nr:STAS domain-containing protein [Thermoleophilia bacterium]